MSIRAKWGLSFFFLIALTLAIEAASFLHWIRQDLARQLAERLRGQSQLFATLVEESLGATGNIAIASQLALTSERLDPAVRVVVAGADGAAVFDSASQGRPSETLSPRSLTPLGGAADAEWEAGGVWHVAVPIRQFGQTAGVIECSASEDGMYPALVVLERGFLGTIVGALLVGVILAFALSSRLVQPIQELEEVTRLISRGEWRKRVSFKRKDELGQLADTVHEMAAALERQFTQLEEEKTTLESLFSSMIDGLIVLDENRNVKFLNPIAERALRVASEASFGKPLESIWPLQEVLDLVSAGLKEKKIASREISLPYNILNLYFVPMAPATGASAMLIFRDITEVRRLEKMRNEFIGQISHELRTPLTIIKGYVVTLMDDPALAASPATNKVLVRIEQEADRLAKLVEEILELSRLKAGRSALTFAPVALDEIAADTVEAFRAHAERYHVHLDFKREKDIPRIMGDAARLKQVLLNLLDNGVKYTPADGKLEVSVAAAGDEVILTVADNGYGIPEEELPYVFERFFQGEKTGRGKGFGLGLPIVKEIVEGHGGKVKITSGRNQGTTVTLAFPGKGLTREKPN